MPKKAEPKPPQAPTPTQPGHAHTWRLSYGPDQTASKVCDCGAQEPA